LRGGRGNLPVAMRLIGRYLRAAYLLAASRLHGTADEFGATLAGSAIGPPGVRYTTPNDAT
jgi:hypothetical protein